MEGERSDAKRNETKRAKEEENASQEEETASHYETNRATQFVFAPSSLGAGFS